MVRLHGAPSAFGPCQKRLLRLPLQAGAMLLLLTDNAWREALPADPSGRWDQARAFIDANSEGVRLASLGGVGLELAALAAAAWLHSLYQAAYEEWRDDALERQERTAAELDRAVQQSYSGVRVRWWRRRGEGGGEGEML